MTPPPAKRRTHGQAIRRAVETLGQGHCPPTPTANTDRKTLTDRPRRGTNRRRAVDARGNKVARRALRLPSAINEVIFLRSEAARRVRAEHRTPMLRPLGHDSPRTCQARRRRDRNTKTGETSGGRAAGGHGAGATLQHTVVDPRGHLGGELPDRAVGTKAGEPTIQEADSSARERTRARLASLAGAGTALARGKPN